jgi:hypothetical protein
LNRWQPLSAVRPLPTRMRHAPLLLLVPLLLSSAAAHEGHGLDEHLVDNGERLMIGRFASAQPGPLLVVPYVDGPLPCAPGSDHAFLVPLSGTAGVSFLANATHVRAIFDTPTPGYTAFAVDTRDAVRALLMMQERAVALHRLAAWAEPSTWNGTRPAELRAGLLGIPYDLPGASMHGLGHDLEGGGIAMSHDATTAGVDVCHGPASDLMGLAIERALLPEALQAGRIVHAVALYDPRVGVFLPRPLDSTEVLQVNLYLARPGEDPERVRAALDPRPGLEEGVGVAALLLGLAWVGRPRS